jgi:hypothetical protein
MALRAMLDNDQKERRNSDEGKHRPYTARETEDAFDAHGTSDDAQNAERRSVMPARIGLAQPSRRLPIAAILRSAATIASQYEILRRAQMKTGTSPRRPSGEAVYECTERSPR